MGIEGWFQFHSLGILGVEVPISSLLNLNIPDFGPRNAIDYLLFRNAR